MSKVDLFVHGQLSKNGYFTCIFGVVHYPMCAVHRVTGGLGGGGTVREEDDVT